MKQHARGKQYTIRGIGPELDRKLREKAARKKISLNQLVVDELTAATLGQRRKTDFSDIVGRWVPDPGFDEVIASQRQLDGDKWK